MQVALATNGQQALDWLERDTHFDCVLMDCQMPVMDGYEATRRIRTDPALRHLPVIAMTANAMAGDRERALAAGMDDYIAKPLDVGSMFRTIARWVGARCAVPGSAAAAVQVLHPPPPAGPQSAHLPGIDTVPGWRPPCTTGAVPFAAGQFHAAQSAFVSTFRAAQGLTMPAHPSDWRTPSSRWRAAWARGVCGLQRRHWKAPAERRIGPVHRCLAGQGGH